MNVRVLRIESRRSVAPWAGAVILVPALAFLYLIPGAWWTGTTAWTAQWTSMALWTRGLLFYLWPLAVGLGALQGLRDHRSKMSELLTSTPRPARHRAAALAGPTALTLASAFALLVLVGAVQVVAHTEYTHLGWLPISLVGALSLVAGALLGMGAARALPSVLTPPALAMGAFVFTALMQMSWGRTETTTTSGIPGTEPNRVSLLSPAVQEAHDALVTLSAAVHVGQTIWLLAMAATGFALLVAATPRARLAALTPVLAGAALALFVLPSDPHRMYVVDEDAAELVCDGPVCVTRTQQARLADLAGPGEEALRLLRAALGSRAPVDVRENAGRQPEGSTPQWSRGSVLFDFDDDIIAAAKGEELTRALIAKGMVPGCSPVGWSGFGNDEYAQTVAVGWVLGDLGPLPGTLPARLRREVDAETRPVWKELRALPRAEQLARIDAMRAAAFSCEGDAFDALSGGASR
ncbi:MULTISPECIES: hypothetical protein [unclassified Streptomyces]|uniref:hypothetical protein n=1 Tax=unclassified Streptomyces TaxID=2593676 RepID=UPI0007089268|nr:hypothetical protein [Streptomyces sp. Root1310]KQX65023.1 hypothetical protein ASD48_18150 [Streptomyces sp. Root1310]